jgi:hypothetical protein
LKDKPTPVTFAGDERIELQNCYVFRDALAHRAQVSIASAVSYTDDPHLFHISIAVPGSKKMTLDLGIPFPQAMKLTRYAVMWDNSINEYDACKIDVVRSLFERHIPDLTAVSWTNADIDAVREMEASNEMQEAVKADLLMIAETSLEGQKDE